MKTLREFIEQEIITEVKTSVDAQNPFPTQKDGKMKSSDFSKIMNYLVNGLGARFVPLKQSELNQNLFRTAPDAVYLDAKYGNESSKIIVTANYVVNNKSKAIKNSDILENPGKQWSIYICAKDDIQTVIKIECNGSRFDTKKCIRRSGSGPNWDVTSEGPKYLYDIGQWLSEYE